MSDIAKIEEILRILKSKIDAHNEFKKKYDKQLAFNFDFFNFFKVGENKISQILAYFLDENQTHGQGNLFLREFVNLFSKDIDISKPNIICEKVITGSRRIDIYIKLENLLIAIENKVWAEDQPNQLKDYAEYLKKESNGNFILLYLTPYGIDPTDKSIDEESKQELIDEGKFKIISYQHDIIILINKWLAICEADNVTYFIKEFRKHLKTKFLGSNTLNMSKDLREIIINEENLKAIEILVKEYNDMNVETTRKINNLENELDIVSLKDDFEIEDDSGIEIVNHGLFNFNSARGYKWSVAKGQNKFWIHCYTDKEKIAIHIEHWNENGTDKFKEKIEKHPNISTKVFKNGLDVNLKEEFLTQVKAAIDIFKKYDEIEKELK